MADVVDRICASCGKPLPERFCAHCGEKRVSRHDYSIIHFGEHILENLTHFDIKSLRALKILVQKPGELTHAYLAGKRKAFIGPIQLFVILNVLFALVGGNTFRTPMSIQRKEGMLVSVKQQWLAEKMAKTGAGEEEFEREFDQTAGVAAKSWIFALIPAYALLLVVLYGFRRYFFEHLVFATHFMTFLLAWIITAGVSIAGGLRLAGVKLGRQQLDNTVSLTILIGMTIYLFLALRRAYGDGRIAASARAIALGVAFLPLLFAYRLLLFFVTLEMMH